MAVVTFSSTYLSSKNKTGKLVPDSNGYYEIVVGGLNIHNSAGDFYVGDNEVKSLFDNPSFVRRIQNGALKGEVGHPVRGPGVSDDQFLDRFLTIQETNVCAHHAKVWLDTDAVKDVSGRPVIAIMARTKPTGPMARVLQESLEDPNQNTAFSVRGFTKDVPFNGRRQRYLKTIITFDYVTEPGISIATKWNSPSAESFSETEVKERDLVKLEKTIQATHVATESALLLTELSWIKNEVFATDHTPLFKKW